MRNLKILCNFAVLMGTSPVDWAGPDVQDEKTSGDTCTASPPGQGKIEGPRAQHQRLPAAASEKTVAAHQAAPQQEHRPPTGWTCHAQQSTFAPDGTVLIDKSSFRCHAAGKSHEVWQGLHASPRSAPSKGRSCAQTIVGLRVLVPCQSHTFSCP